MVDKRLAAWFDKKVAEAGVDPQEFDLRSLVDGTLSYNEQKQQLKDILDQYNLLPVNVSDHNRAHRARILDNLHSLEPHMIDVCTGYEGLSKFGEYSKSTESKFNSFLSCVGRQVIPEEELGEYDVSRNMISFLNDERDKLTHKGPILEAMNSKLARVLGEEVFTKMTGLPKDNDKKDDWLFTFSSRAPTEEDYKPIVLKRLRGV